MSENCQIRRFQTGDHVCTTSKYDNLEPIIPGHPHNKPLSGVILKVIDLENASDLIVLQDKNGTQHYMSAANLEWDRRHMRGER